MNYDLSGLKTYTEQGIIISNIKAQARWLDNGTNTASKDKQNIFMRTDLTPTQAKGYFANELWEIEYSVNEDGTKTYTKGAEDAPERTDNNILGESVISSLTPESYGSIYLFLDENNGNTDRQGELVFTADVTQGGSTKNVTIGKGTFKQLCPSWNPNNVGVERFENDNLITNNYPFGFCYNRVISYTNGQAVTYDRLLEYSEFLAKAYRFILWLFGALVDDIIPNTEGMAKDFVAIEYTSDGDYIRKITFNFGALNQLDELTDSSNGLNNTMVLFNYTGGVDLADLETQFDKTLSEWTKTEVVKGEKVDDYAAYVALSRNRVREIKTTNTSSDSGPTYEVQLHKDESGNVILEWYLPALNEAKSLIEVGIEQDNINVSPLNGTYWTSTAGQDPNAEAGITYGYAYSCTFTNNSYSSTNDKTSRKETHKVRAVRKKPTTTTEQE